MRTMSPSGTRVLRLVAAKLALAGCEAASSGVPSESPPSPEPKPAPTSTPPRASDLLFRCDFEEPVNGPSKFMYNFASKVPMGSWRGEHLPRGGFGGTGGVHIVMLTGQVQYTLGFITPPLAHTFAMGDGVYLRFRIRYDETTRASNDWGNKFILMGRTRTSPNSRVIVHMRPPAESSNWTLGMRDWSDPEKRPYPWAVPSHFGIEGFSSFLGTELTPYSWGLSAGVNIGWDCAPAVFQTIPSNPYRGAPGPHSERARDGWYHVQIYAQSGQPGQGMFKVWANNNSQSTPTSERIGLPEGLGVEGWSEAVKIGGYADNRAPLSDVGYTLDDFEIGLTFDPNWSR